MYSANIYITDAPKKTAEGLATVQKGTGEKPNVGLDTVVAKTALSTYSKL
jgi:hypothetical protein